MRIVCVAGGSYKSFYLNYFLKLSKCDLLIFNYGIFYNLNNDNISSSIVGIELLNLSQKLNCVVVAGLRVNKKQVVVVCKNNKIYLAKHNKCVKFKVKNKQFSVSFAFVVSNASNKIILTNKRINVNIMACSAKKTYLIVHKKGADLIKNKKMQRKFNKYLKFILK